MHTYESCRYNDRYCMNRRNHKGISLKKKSKSKEIPFDSLDVCLILACVKALSYVLTKGMSEKKMFVSYFLLVMVRNTFNIYLRF